MERKVDIRWVEGGRLEATLRWGNKRGGYIFYLLPTNSVAMCNKCCFRNNSLCSRYNKTRRNQFLLHLCSELWNLRGDNKFEGRDKIRGWQPVGELVRKRKNRI